MLPELPGAYRKNSNNSLKFPPLEKGRKTPKICPGRQKKKKKTPDHTKRGNSNVLAQGSFIRVLTVPDISLIISPDPALPLLLYCRSRPAAANGSHTVAVKRSGWPNSKYILPFSDCRGVLNYIKECG